MGVYMNSYSFRIHAQEDGVEIQNLNKYSYIFHQPICGIYNRF